MRKILVIARREYLAAVQTKMFLFSLVILPVLMAGSAVVQFTIESHAQTKDKTFAVIDRTPGGRLVALLEARARERNEKRSDDPADGAANDSKGNKVRAYFIVVPVPPRADVQEQRCELSEQVLKRVYFGFLDIGPDVFSKKSGGSSGERADLVYQSNNLLSDAIPRWAEGVINEAVQKQRTTDLHLDPELIPIIMRPVPLVRRPLTERNPQTGAPEEVKAEGQVASIAIPVGLTCLMFMVVMLGANPLMQGVVEEKMQRIAEVLLGSVEPFQLMMGKLLGMAGVSLTVAAVYLGGVYWAAASYRVTDYLPTSVIVWFLIYQVLAVLMYGSLFIAVGAACTDMKETQTLLLPVVFLVVLPLLALGPVVQEPNGVLARWLSFVPFATPMLMMARQTSPPGIPWWEPVVGVVLVVATTLACVYAAGRIFRVGLLMQGKGARVSDLVRWVVRG